jgi:hypothetical protein
VDLGKTVVRIQYWMAGKLGLLIVPAMLVLVTNVAADPKVGPTQSSLSSPQLSTVNQDKFSLQDTSPANPLIFGSGSPLFDLQAWGTVTKLNQESSEPSTDTWRPEQPPKLENLFNNDSFHFSGAKNIQIAQPAARDDCVDNDDECTQNSGLPHSRSTKIHSGNFNSGNFNKTRKPLIGLSVSVPIQ